MVLPLDRNGSVAAIVPVQSVGVSAVAASDVASDFKKLMKPRAPGASFWASAAICSNVLSSEPVRLYLSQPAAEDSASNESESVWNCLLNSSNSATVAVFQSICETVGSIFFRNLPSSSMHFGGISE